MPNNYLYVCQQGKIYAPMTTPKCKWFILFKANYLLLKEPPDHTWNEPTPDKPMEGSVQDKKITYACHL